MPYDVSITDVGTMALFDLKGTAKDIAEWCGNKLPAFPKTTSTFSQNANCELMWLGRQNWILRAPLEQEFDLTADLDPAGAPYNISIVCISDTMQFFALSGPDIAEILAVATPLDTHESVFPVNGATYSEAFGIKALIVKSEDGFHLGIERSFGPMIADYLARTLAG